MFLFSKLTYVYLVYIRTLILTVYYCYINVLLIVVYFYIYYVTFDVLIYSSTYIVQSSTLHLNQTSQTKIDITVL